MANQSVISEYEATTKRINALLKKIEAGLLTHNKDAASQLSGHNWCHVGDLNYIESELKDVADFFIR